MHLVQCDLDFILFFLTSSAFATSLPTFNVWPPLASQGNYIYMAFCWWADGGPLLDVYWDVPFEHCLSQENMWLDKNLSALAAVDKMNESGIFYILRC